MSQTHATTFSEFCNSPEEVHAVMAGIHHALSRRKNPLKFGDQDKHISPELLQDLRKEYHYYIGAFWATRLIILLITTISGYTVVV
jgi:hypothetical protein